MEDTATVGGTVLVVVVVVLDRLKQELSTSTLLLDSGPGVISCLEPLPL